MKRALSEKAESENSLQTGTFSTDNRLFAVADSQKRIFILDTNDWMIQRELEAERRVSKMCFNGSCSFMLCADRTGDVYSFDLTDTTIKKGKLLMGHLSMILDLKLSPDQKFLISSDRDEKIRISKYPNCYNIESFCMGHKEYVSSIVVWNDEWIISGSGDGSLRLWNFKLGKLINKLQFPCNDGEPKPAVKEAIKINDHQLAVYFYMPTVVSVVDVSENGSLTMNTSISFHFPIITCRSLDNKQLLVVSQNFDKPFRILDMKNKFQDSKEANVAELIEGLSSIKQFEEALFKVSNEEDVRLRNKQWFSNVDQYLEKKQKRIEDKMPAMKKVKNDGE